MKRILCVLALLCAALSAPAYAAPTEVARALPGAAVVGSARYQVLAWRVFDATLYSMTGAFSWERPFALSLTYQRAFTGQALVRRTISEMTERGAAPSAALRAQLAACFTDVSAGDRFTGVSEAADRAVFYLNGAERCRVEAAGFRRAFFGIWLDADGAEARMSARLRGDA